MLNQNCFIDFDPRTFDILRISPKKDAAYLRGIRFIKGLANILFELFVQHGLYLTPRFRFRHLMNYGTRIFRNAFFNIFQIDKIFIKDCLTWPFVEPEFPSLIFLSTWSISVFNRTSICFLSSRSFALDKYNLLISSLRITLICCFHSSTLNSPYLTLLSSA